MWGGGIAAAVLIGCLGRAEVPVESPVKAVAVPPVLKGRQGDVVSVTVMLPSPGAAPVGRLADHLIPFFPLDETGRFGALVGIDLDAPVGKRRLAVEVGGAPVAELAVIVTKQQFPVQTLTVPDEMVHLDEPTLARVKREQAEVEIAMAPVSPQRWWHGAFIAPTEGKILGSFGRHRIINGEPRSTHSGEDISAPDGSPVVASNDGVVRLVADHYFSGKSIYLDHGDGLYSMYFHLSQIRVAASQQVHKGEVIGLVGSSGRATGPHLHWGVRLNGARVNPFELLQVTFP